MRISTSAMALISLLASPCFGAPLFPDVASDHWAAEAVSRLAKGGLIEGYPAGKFRGDRAVTRWELALVVARLLSKMEVTNATFATKAERDELTRLVQALRPELDSLGVRVTHLEGTVDNIEQRVNELSRITFYGYVDTRFSAISLQNTGLAASQALPSGIPLINYNAAVGSSIGAGGAIPPVTGFALPPAGFGNTINYANGRPLLNGLSFTSRAVLGIRANLSEDFEAGMELSAYSAQGNQTLDALYGANPPYLTSAFTANSSPAAGLGGPSNNSPYTRAVLDSFWVTHRASNTTLRLGSFTGHHFDPIVFAGQTNPNEFGPEYLPNFGFQLTGEHSFGDPEELQLQWEVMGTRLPNGNTGIPAALGLTGEGYYGAGYGANVKLSFDDRRGQVKLNYFRMSESQLSSGPRTIGLNLIPNLTLNWVNPNGYFRNQIGLLNSQGLNTTSDQRPIAGLGALGADGSVASAVALGLLPAGTPNVGGFGPQDQTNYGLSAAYTFEAASFDPKIHAEYAHSVYKPQTNSSYVVGGNAYSAGASALFFDRQVEADARYLHVDPTYDPFIITTPTVGGIANILYHFPDFSYYPNLSPSHSIKDYPHNRQGVRAKLRWSFAPTGKVNFEYSNLSQVRSSLQDVRFGANSLAPGTPNTDVLGYSPGFIEPFFGAYSANTFAPAGGNRFAVPLEDHKGAVETLLFTAGHKWLFDEENSQQGVTLRGGVGRVHFKRDSNLSSLVAGPLGVAGENQNYVDLMFTGWQIGTDYDVTEDFTAKLSYTNVGIYGHYDPLGLNNAYAAAVGTSRFNNSDLRFSYPELGFNWQLEDGVSWNCLARFYSLSDRVPTHVFTNYVVPGLNLDSGPASIHPFSWHGTQLSTQFLVKF